MRDKIARLKKAAEALVDDGLDQQNDVEMEDG